MERSGLNCLYKYFIKIYGTQALLVSVMKYKIASRYRV